jgi:hemerythrin-like domain-containing protein
MLNSAKIKIVFPNGEIIKCDDLIALTRNYNNLREFQQVLIGDWSLEDIIDNKLFLSQLFENQIKEHLSSEDKAIFDSIISKQEEVEKDIKSRLSFEERELYDVLFPENKLFISGKNDEEIDEESLMDFFEELLDDLENDKVYQKQNQGQSHSKLDFTDKIIDLEEYRKKKSY